MPEEKKRNPNWGGARPGAGRKVREGEPRKQHQVRATEAEWAMIKEFTRIVKEDPERAGRMMETE